MNGTVVLIYAAVSMYSNLIGSLCIVILSVGLTILTVSCEKKEVIDTTVVERETEARLDLYVFKVENMKLRAAIRENKLFDNVTFEGSDSDYKITLDGFDERGNRKYKRVVENSVKLLENG